MPIGQLTMIHPEVLQRSNKVESPEPPKRVTTVRSDDGQGPLRNGVGVDGEWEYQRVHQGPWGR